MNYFSSFLVLLIVRSCFISDILSGNLIKSSLLVKGAETCIYNFEFTVLVQKNNLCSVENGGEETRIPYLTFIVSPPKRVGENNAPRTCVRSVAGAD